MPAILDEAFNSPFSRFKGLNPHGPLAEEADTDTASIRNPGMTLTLQPPLQSAPPPVTHMVTNMDHDCDRLIARIMACPHCRQQLLKLQNQQQTQGHGSIPSPQAGGDPLVDLNTTIIGNFLFGIALIFIVDRIVRLKLK